MTPAEKLLALCEDVEGLALLHHPRCELLTSGCCDCGQAEGVKALEALSAALKVCVEGLQEESKAGWCREWAKTLLSEAARLAGEEDKR